MGKDDHTDLLTIVYDTPRLIGEHFGPRSIELEDMYYKLDTELGILTDYLLAQFKPGEVVVVLTSDHGTIQVDRPVRVQGDRETSSNLRYKTGRNLGFNPKEVFAITKPEQAHLPKSNITSTYIFAYNRDFFVYPNDTNRFVRYYNDTFQHGGISMEEMIIPFIVMKPR